VIRDESTVLKAASTSPDGSILFYSSQILARGPDWSAGADVGNIEFTQCAALSRSNSITLQVPSGDDAVNPNTVVLVRRSTDDNGSLIIRGPACAEKVQGELFPLLIMQSNRKSYWLHRTSEDTYSVAAKLPSGEIVAGEKAEIRRFEVIHRFSANRE
jgi:hypothetical protein